MTQGILLAARVTTHVVHTDGVRPKAGGAPGEKVWKQPGPSRRMPSTPSTAGHTGESKEPPTWKTFRKGIPQRRAEFHFDQEDQCSEKEMKTLKFWGRTNVRASRAEESEKVHTKP